MSWQGHRYSRAVTRTERWKRLRVEILRRDKWCCVKCGARGNLEIDHIESVRIAPDLAYEPKNLQALCKSCHSIKTQNEVFGDGNGPDPEKIKWRQLLRSGFRN